MNEKVWDYIDKLNQLSSLTPEQQAGEGYVTEGVSPELIEKDVNALLALVKEAREACPEDWMFYLVANCFYFSMGLHMVYPHDLNKFRTDGETLAVENEKMKELLFENVGKSMELFLQFLPNEEIELGIICVFLCNGIYFERGMTILGEEEDFSFDYAMSELPDSIQYYILLFLVQNMAYDEENKYIKVSQELLSKMAECSHSYIKEWVYKDFWQTKPPELLTFVPRLSFESTLDDTIEFLTPLMEELLRQGTLSLEISNKISDIFQNVKFSLHSGIPCRAHSGEGGRLYYKVSSRKKALLIEAPSKLSQEIIEVYNHLSKHHKELTEKEKELKRINVALLQEKERNERLVALHGHSWKYFSYPKLLEEVSEILYGRGNEEDVALGSDLQNAHHQSMMLHNQLMNLVNEFTHTAEGKRQLFSDSILPPDHGESIQNLVDDTVKQLLYYAVFSPPGNLTGIEQVPTSVFHPDRRKALEECYQEEFKKNEGWIDPIDWFTREIYPFTVEISPQWENFSFHYPKQAYVQVTTILMNLLSNAMNYGKKSKNKGFMRLNLGAVEKNGTKYLLIRCENPISADTAFLGRTGQGLLSLDEMAKSIHQKPPLFSEPYGFLQTKEKKGCFIVELYLEECLFLGSEVGADA